MKNSATTKITLGFIYLTSTTPPVVNKKGIINVNPNKYTKLKNLE
jgi:hypothetical protein